MYNAWFYILFSEMEVSKNKVLDYEEGQNYTIHLYADLLISPETRGGIWRRFDESGFQN